MTVIEIVAVVAQIVCLLVGFRIGRRYGSRNAPGLKKLIEILQRMQASFRKGSHTPTTPTAQREQQGFAADVLGDVIRMAATIEESTELARDSASRPT